MFTASNRAYNLKPRGPLEGSVSATSPMATQVKCGTRPGKCGTVPGRPRVHLPSTHVLALGAAARSIRPQVSPYAHKP